MEHYKEYLEVGLQLIGSLSIVATIIVRLTPSKSDDEKLDKLLQKFHLVLAWAPTFGINPKTKELMDAQKAMK